MALVSDRSHAVVVFGLMTPNHATAAFIGFGKLDGQGPLLTEGNFFTDVFVLVACMHLVASLAATPFRVLVNMHKVQVGITVSKVGELGRELVDCNIFIVAIKTHRVVFSLVGHVEGSREALFQYLGVVRAVRVVTGVAVVLLNRPVKIFSRAYLSAHIGVADIAHFFCRRF